MKWTLIAGAVLVGLVVMMAVIGALLPKGHVASRSAEFKVAPDAIWAIITNVQAFPEWRTGVAKVEILHDAAPKRWREEGPHGAITFEVAEARPPEQWITRIADPKLPFGGSWTYQIAPTQNGSSLTITENGEVYNVFFRFLSRFVFGYTSTMDGFLNSLGGKLGEKVTISSRY